MAQQQTEKRFYKYQVNGVDYYTAEPWLGNVPKDYTPISAQEYLSGVDQFKKDHPKDWKNYVNTADVTLAQSLSPTATGGGESGYIIENGVPRTLASAQERDRLANDPNMTNVGTADKPMYVPKGSAAELLATNPTAYYQQYPDQAPKGDRTLNLEGQTQFYNAPKQTSVMGASTPQYQIINLDAMSQYRPNEYYRDASGKVFLNPGVTPKPGTTKTMGGTTINPQGSNLPSSTQGTSVPQQTTQINGVDTTGWSADMVAAFQVLQQQVDTLAAQGKRINPNITIDDATINRFMDQAKSEVDPYYKQLISQAQSDLTTALTRTSEDYASKQRDIGRAFGKNLESTQENFARRGLNFSSDRTRAEQELARNTNEALASAQQDAQRSGQDIGNAYERKLGTSFLPDTSNIGIGSNAQAITGTPGVYGITNPTQSRQLFQSTPDTFGTLQAEQITAQQTRKNDLINAERELRAANYL